MLFVVVSDQRWQNRRQSQIFLQREFDIDLPREPSETSPQILPILSPLFEISARATYNGL